MAEVDQSLSTILEPLRLAVKEQGDLVRSLKESSAAEIDIKKAVHELKSRKKILEEREISLLPKETNFDRVKMDDLLKRRFFLDHSFSIYGGIAGQFDLGPMGCAMKMNFINAWRNHFVFEEQLLEVDCTILTPEPILRASGHVERFADFMVKDTKTGECFRLDHLIKSGLEKLCQEKTMASGKKSELLDLIVKLDGYGKQELNELMRKYDLKSPLTGNELTDAMEFNLMFNTSIGPSGEVKAYLRPETAQGIFVNFKRLLDFNQGRLPFGAAQIGNAFRNEISPRAGLLRVREFTMAEIEYFIDPSDKSHPKFDDVKETELILFSASNQMDGQSARPVKIKDAIEDGIISSQVLAYFMARINLFLERIGVDPRRCRFRQHMTNEMAHYACDCWDAECLTSYGWVECVGCADRSCYDLVQHSKATNTRLTAEKMLKEPKEVDVVDCIPQKAFIGKKFKNDSKYIMETLSKLNNDEISEIEKMIGEAGEYPLKIGENVHTISKEMVTIKRYKKLLHVEEIIPSVIEPSFGIGRLMYTIWEHNFRVRDGDEQRTFFSLPPLIAPIKCSVLPLSGNQEFVPFIKEISNQLNSNDISNKIDDSSGSIGRRYARTDEIAIPFGITIDFDTLQEPHTVTLRERDSVEQIRIPINDVGCLLKTLSNGKINWTDITSKYPKFIQQEKKGV